MKAPKAVVGGKYTRWMWLNVRCPMCNRPMKDDRGTTLLCLRCHITATFKELEKPEIGYKGHSEYVAVCTDIEVPNEGGVR